MKVLNIKDNENGTCDVEMQMNDEEQRLLIEKGFTTLLEEYLDNNKIDSEDETNENSENLVDIIESNRPEDFLFAGIFTDNDDRNYYLYISSAPYKYMNWYESVSLCRNLSNVYDFSIPKEYELREILTNGICKIKKLSNMESLWCFSDGYEPKILHYSTYSTWSYAFSSLSNLGNKASITPVLRVYI